MTEDRTQELDDMIAEFESKELATPNKAVSGGIYGLEAEDLKMPYMYLVRGGSQYAVLADGSKAAEGTFYHSTKKTSVDSLDVIIALAKKERVEKMKDNKPVINADGQPELESVWRTLMININNMYAPFSFSFKGMNYWLGFKDFLTALQSQGKNMNEVVVRLTSEIKELKTEKGDRKYPTVKLTILTDASEEQKRIAKELENRFASQRFDSVEE